MEYSTQAEGQGISPAGVIYALGGLCDRFQRLRDSRKAKGKRYSLLSLVVLIFLAKLSGQDKRVEIADWARDHAAALVILLHLRDAWMPHHNTIRRVFQAILSEAEFEQLLKEYHQQQPESLGDILAMDGKALEGNRPADQSRSDFVLSVYDSQTQRVPVRAAVDTKENEIVGPAPIGGG